MRQSAGWNTVPIVLGQADGTWKTVNAGVGSYARWATVAGVKPLVGDFNGDGRSDIALVRQTEGWGTVPVAHGQADGTWKINDSVATGFSTWATSERVKPLVGDFNGDGRSDIALVKQATSWSTVPVALGRADGSWEVENPGVGAYAGWATRVGVTPFVGNFNGGSSDDIALIAQTPGWGTIPLLLGP